MNNPRLIHIYTGESKGKTTAAVGLAVRAVGAGWKVLFCSFYKPDGSSEHAQLEKLGINFRRFAWRGNFFKRYSKEELEEQKKAFNEFIVKVQKDWDKFDIVILDEVVYAISGKVISENDFLEFLNTKPITVELVLTGRDFPKSIIEKAQYVTNMKSVKHPFDKGGLPRKGIEF